MKVSRYWKNGTGELAWCHKPSVCKRGKKSSACAKLNKMKVH